MGAALRQPAPAVSLDDKYALKRGRAFMTGIQALVRLPMLQRDRDRAAGLDTGGFISGYRGSPLGTYDSALRGAAKYLAEDNIHFQPGVNEDLAATSLWGSQQVGLFPGAKVDGVFGIWYGKGPGVDRSADVIKHANAAGTARNGGVLLVAGDDHGCQSSTLPHQSDHILIAAMVPTLYPATVQDYLDFGLMGFALSRYCGCWVGFKAVSETAESGATVELDPDRVRIVIPDDPLPPGGLHIRVPDTPLEQERRLHGPKMAAVAAFARANPFDRLVKPAPQARFGIAAAGKSYLDVIEALEELDLNEDLVRIYKIGLTWPLETEGARRFADGLEEILVVEEKRSVIEEQFLRLLFNAPSRPRILGKLDEAGRRLLPSEGELSPIVVARVIAGRLAALGLTQPGLAERAAQLEARAAPPAAATALKRVPFFCSGCPHNTSTRLPDGSRGLAGIGCHGMVTWMPKRRTETITHMGGEGANWIGQAPFTEERHVFQNLGDGTFFHSGLLAIRAAAAAGVNITYKILFNDAVAMTGGQSHDGPLTVPAVARQVDAEGARRVVVVTDEPGKYPADAGFPAGTEIRHRDDLDAVQRELREVEGLTVLIYDQTCAAEKRRRRKRGEFPDPPKRVFINDLVCEGCGDCSAKSNCISVKPLETEFGRKRQIDQSSCNKDFSCLKGFCPSFVTVHGGTPRQARALAEGGEDPAAGLARPAASPLAAPYSILLTGIGGTGVITVGALLAMAAHIEGRACTVLDFTGLAQKNGAVMSHIRIAREKDELAALRIPAGGADLVLGCDMMVASTSEALARFARERTRAVVNSHVEPTADFIDNGDVDFREDAMRRAIIGAAAAADFIEATRLATRLMGDSIAANLFLLGFAWQRGLVPVGFDALMQAIELNKVAVAANKRSFAWGRLAAEDMARVATIAGAPAAAGEPETLAGIVARRVAFLTAYQSAAYARRYHAIVERAEAAERRQAGGLSGFAEAVARSLFKLMAYKDEYEVARLYAEPAFRRKLAEQFEDGYRLEFHLAPPVLSRLDPVTGEPAKRSFGPWMMHGFSLLARFRRLRGTWLDPFGRTEERRTERALIADFEARVSELCDKLAPANHRLATEIAALPQHIRGYGPVKARHLGEVRAREADLLAAFRAPPPLLDAAE